MNHSARIVSFNRLRRSSLRAVAPLALAASLASPAAAQTVELLANGDFAAGQDPWWATTNLAARSDDGRFCVDVPAGTSAPWDAIIGQRDIPIVAGETYELSFDASATVPVVIRSLVQNPTTYAAFSDRNPSLSPVTSHFSYTFTAGTSLDAAELALQLGGASAAWTLCIDDVSLVAGAAPYVYTPDTGSRVRVNQLGYLPSGPKVATLVSEQSAPVAWQLLASDGRVVRSGLSQPRGIDPTSGASTHSIRFDRVRERGSGYTLVADGETSHPFDISPSLYAPLRRDAWTVLYTQRSGIAIESALAGEAYARAAGHVGVAPNQGDVAVPCMSPEVSLPVYGEPWTCSYTLDVSGGWYDAGDHGKYVVNAGISVAQLLSLYERAELERGASRWARRDGSLSIPERDNGVPDVLDEVRWELEWMLRMQVPAGEALAGMVHHKVHDAQWTGLPLLPAQDDQARLLHRPSTAATLNLAAAAAQGARLYRRFDHAFAARLLDAARRAWDAALANPVLYAPGAAGQGGGSYSDADVSDEFYWAAAELYLSTGEAMFERAVLDSPLHGADVFPLEGYAWNSMAAIARMDLVRVPSSLPGRRALGRSVLAGADALVALSRAQAFGQPYAPASGSWVWGSNSNLLNNLIVIATAYDLSGKREYRDAVIEGFDYLLGRNALNISFVTGHGEVHARNQHSRIYAAQLNAELPHPPAGTLAGGPNTDLSDPVARENLTGCIGQRCYIDDIGSYSTNELAINWNAPLAWVAAFLAEAERAP
jgi:endoglucanase